MIELLAPPAKTCVGGIRLSDDRGQARDKQPDGSMPEMMVQVGGQGVVQPSQLSQDVFWQKKPLVPPPLPGAKDIATMVTCR